MNVGSGMTVLRISTLAFVAFLAACGSQDETLSGERLTSLGEDVSETPSVSNEIVGLRISPSRANASWTHVGGSPQHRVAHPALGSSLSQIWTTQIGAKDTKKNRTTAQPVVKDGRVFVKDSLSNVVALTTSGTILWRRDLAPPLELGAQFSSGGMAIDGSALYVTTGAGDLIALDPQNGDVLWEQDLESFGGSAPTVYGDLVYVSARDGSAWAINKDNGRIEWQLAGPAVASSFVGGPGPAITDKWALFPFGSGEVLSTYRRGGLRNWTASVTGGRSGQAVAIINDISGDPVVVGNSVYVGTATGPTVSLDLNTGERNWSMREGVFDALWVDGNSMFFVNDQNVLMRVSSGTGEKVWELSLPRFLTDKPHRRRGVVAHYGPILAGGRLIVASSDERLRFFDPETGGSKGSITIDGGAASAPIVVNNTLYVQTRNGKLLAFR